MAHFRPFLELSASDRVLSGLTDVNRSSADGGKKNAMPAYRSAVLDMLRQFTIQVAMTVTQFHRLLAMALEAAGARVALVGAADVFFRVGLPTCICSGGRQCANA